MPTKICLRFSRGDLIAATEKACRSLVQKNTLAQYKIVAHVHSQFGQPWGWKDIRERARERAENDLRCNPDASFAIGVAEGPVPLAYKEWAYTAALYVLRKDLVSEQGWGPLIPLPGDIIEECDSKSGLSVREAMYRKFGNFDNPYALLTRCSTPPTDTFAWTIESILEKLAEPGQATIAA